MKGRLIEQYDLTLSKREMDELVIALRVFTRDYESHPIVTDLLGELEEIYHGSGGTGTTVPLRAITDGDKPETAGIEDEENGEGGSAVPA